MIITDKQIKAFRSKILILPNGCHEWQGYRRTIGDYGAVRIGLSKDNTRRIEGAHRVAFFLAHGYVPDLLRHSCDYPPCCNVEHLLVGTHQENMSDKVTRGRSYLNRPEQGGEANTAAKLTQADVDRIRLLFPVMNNKEIAALFGVTHSNISCIRRGKSWQQPEFSS